MTEAVLQVPDTEMPVQVALEDSAETQIQKGGTYRSYGGPGIGYQEYHFEGGDMDDMFDDILGNMLMEEVLQVAAEEHQDLPEDLEVKALNQKVLISRQVSL